MKPNTLILTPITSIPLIKPGINLAELFWQSLKSEKIEILNGDILVVTQKIVSKAENRLINLSMVTPSQQAFDIAKISKKDPRFIELIISESDEILRVTPTTIITQHKLGFVCANAGIDHSNVLGDWGNNKDWYLLLPQNPDESAQEIRDYFKNRHKRDIGVLIIDSHGRAWRYGTVGMTIGLAGVPGIVDLRGKEDLFGYKLRITRVAAADELAAGASLIMGQANEMIPLVHARGFPYKIQDSTNFSEIIRKKEKDLFR